MRRVLSFDLDNCLFHCGYSADSRRDEMEVISTNKVLLDSIIADKGNFDELIVMVGSARQSASSDRFNSRENNTESGFTAIRKISEHISARLDTFLLADVYGDTPDGTASHNAINPSYSGTHHDWINDATKITILYSQIHKIANLYPEDEITFDFYDDRGIGSWLPLDILEHLNTYFKRNPTMLPSNVTVRLNHYEGAKVTSFKPIRGTGMIDTNYRQVIKDMTELAKNIPPLSTDSKFFPNSVFHVTPEQLVNRKYHSPIPQKEACLSTIPSSLVEHKKIMAGVIINEQDSHFELAPLITAKPQTVKEKSPCDYLSSCFRSMFSFFDIAIEENSIDEKSLILKNR
mgnify:CR=1 FL=1